jgi:hypothetical protein
MTVYTGSTFQTCALRVWGLWVSMRDLHKMTVRYINQADQMEADRRRTNAPSCGHTRDRISI